MQNMTKLRKQGLILYYNILKLHRARLPNELRTLGNKYVGSEFRAHKTAKFPQYIQFLEGWIKYYNQLCDAPSIASVGQNLSEEDSRFLNEDQKANLQKMKMSLQPDQTIKTAGEVSKNAQSVEILNGDNKPNTNSR